MARSSRAGSHVLYFLWETFLVVESILKCRRGKELDPAREASFGHSLVQQIGR